MKKYTKVEKSQANILKHFIFLYFITILEKYI